MGTVPVSAVRKLRVGIGAADLHDARNVATQAARHI